MTAAYYTDFSMDNNPTLITPERGYRIADFVVYDQQRTSSLYSKWEQSAETPYHDDIWMQLDSEIPLATMLTFEQTQ